MEESSVNPLSINSLSRAFVIIAFPALAIAFVIVFGDSFSIVTEPSTTEFAISARWELSANGTASTLCLVDCETPSTLKAIQCSAPALKALIIPFIV